MEIAPMPNKTNPTRLRIRLYFENGTMFGPGKADLLALIAETGSISAAGRHLGMSYKRAWGLVDVMNGMFAEPLVESSRGGAKHGGATLTETGETVLTLYREFEANTRSASAGQLEALEQLLAPAGTANADMFHKK